jgi:hypothetical protein
MHRYMNSVINKLIINLTWKVSLSVKFSNGSLYSYETNLCGEYILSRVKKTLLKKNNAPVRIRG